MISPGEGVEVYLRVIITLTKGGDARSGHGSTFPALLGSRGKG
jgi:hypothetical protein